MVAVLSSPLFDNNFPLNITDGYTHPKAKDAVVDAVVGAAAGAPVNVSLTRVKHSTNSVARDGGRVVLESESLINRNTTAQDLTNIERDAARRNRASFGFVRDLSGNGGPAYTRSY